MRVIATLLLIPGLALAQSFDAPPPFETDGAAMSATLTDDCVNLQAALGPTALVSPAARDCIGLSAKSGTDDPATGAKLEEAYWQWRIAQIYLGLAAWVADKPQSAQLDSLRESVANPAAATAHIPLECALRAGQTDVPATADADLSHCQMRETALFALELEYTVRQACLEPGTGEFADFCGKGGQ